MKILITGAAGFIGASLVSYLLEKGYVVVGLDNINDYYDVNLKYDRLERNGINRENVEWGVFVRSRNSKNYKFVRMSLEDRDAIACLMESEKFDQVCHLGAQAGVRYSIQNPYSYIDSNIMGFLNILEGCRNNPVKHLVYASSSSVYGLNADTPFCEDKGVDHPVSLYAATKKSNELMAHAYAYLYNIPCTGLRFFTVYGPWGRPDMSPFLFTNAIMNKQTIKVYNYGHMLRDFTYIDDVVEGIARVLGVIPEVDKTWDAKNPNPSSSICAYRIFNIGNSQPIPLLDFIGAIEKACGREAIKDYWPMQAGDVYQTNADTTLLQKRINYKPSTSIQEGVLRYVEWYKSYYKID